MSDYRVERGVIIYACPRCRSELRSPLNEGGTRQRCPDCNEPIDVPGAKEKLAHLQAAQARLKQQEEAAEAARAQRAQQEEAAEAARAERAQQDLQQLEAAATARPRHAAARPTYHRRGGVTFAVVRAALLLIGVGYCGMGAWEVKQSLTERETPVNARESALAKGIESLARSVVLERGLTKSGLGVLMFGCAAVLSHQDELLRTVDLRT